MLLVFKDKTSFLIKEQQTSARRGGLASIPPSPGLTLQAKDVRTPSRFMFLAPHFFHFVLERGSILDWEEFGQNEMQLLDLAGLEQQTNYMRVLVYSGSVGVWKQVSKNRFSRRLEGT